MTRLDLLREQIAEQQLDGFIIPRGDAFSGEEVPPCDDRLRYISGFSGSAGTAIVTPDQAVLFSDGRYTLQMKAETTDDWSCFVVPDHSMVNWLKENLSGQRLGFDPWLMTVSAEKSLREKLSSCAINLIAVNQNPIDQIWVDQPSMPQSMVWDYNAEYAGMTRAQKVKAVMDELLKDLKDHAHNNQHLLITAPDQLAWLANIRADDLDHTPVLLAFARLSPKGKIIIYGDQTRFSNCDRDQLAFKPADELLQDLSGLDQDTILYDPATCPVALKAVFNDMARPMESPISIMKARKNISEQRAIKSAHCRDGIAMARFLCWFDEHAQSGIREVDIADQLIHFRAMDDQFISSSFATICGSGGNGAIVHYRAEPGRDSAILNNTLCLIDSGGQYKEATTDITRTIAVGTPSPAMKKDFTIVLKGHIALDQAVFPEGTSGVQLDAITRAPLWQAGMDFAHGTGHGVGCCLNVHEGPVNISKRSTRAIEPGMLLSNEPGFYIENEYGIRIENLILSQASKTRPGFVEFDHVTLVPMDKNLIEVDLLTQDEIDWVNRYHQRVWNEISPDLADDPKTQSWLKQATSPL